MDQPLYALAQWNWPGHHERRGGKNSQRDQKCRHQQHSNIVEERFVKGENPATNPLLLALFSNKQPWSWYLEE
ncbi:hypothetical protein PoB_001557800 [Plakobranchus ocellatus]|uniref:Uncharacterized protein n=1 Tax=Plakobranchus ocellatus TaxID=259542 RepID=A0AAV3Z2S1_9GAST|nr:hypothetical protein PoB_001557800 [Plakobranchus ocellatus]